MRFAASWRFYVVGPFGTCVRARWENRSVGGVEKMRIDGVGIY